MAPPRKGYDRSRSLRYPSDLDEPLILLARLQRHSVNDLFVIAAEQYVERHADQLAAAGVKISKPRKAQRR